MPSGWPVSRLERLIGDASDASDIYLLIRRRLLVEAVLLLLGMDSKS